MPERQHPSTYGKNSSKIRTPLTIVINSCLSSFHGVEYRRRFVKPKRVCVPVRLLRSKTSGRRRNKSATYKAPCPILPYLTIYTHAGETGTTLEHSSVHRSNCTAHIVTLCGNRKNPATEAFAETYPKGTESCSKRFQRYSRPLPCLLHRTKRYQG